MMLGARQSLNQEPTPYATGADFHWTFANDMNHLYLLSFLLTSDHSLAEKCFVRSLDDSAKGNRVFKDWVQSWAERTIVQNAVQIVRPRPANSSTPNRTTERNTGGTINPPAEIAAVVRLAPFERFAFVLSVLERYSDQECSLLLNCSRGDLVAARTQALRWIGRSAEHADMGPDEHLSASA